MKIHIAQNALKAVSHYMAVKDVRYYLNGMYMEANANTSRLVATNEHCMGIYQHATISAHKNDVYGLVSFIVPDAAIKAIAKIKAPKKYTGDVIFNVPDDYEKNPRAVFSAEYANTVIHFLRIDGIFPQYNRVVPDTVFGEPATYNPKYLALGNDAAFDLGIKFTPALEQNGQTWPGIQHISENMIALVMPICNKVLLKFDNAWARTALTGIESPSELLAA